MLHRHAAEGSTGSAAIDAATTFVGHGDPWTQELRLAVELARAAGPS